MPCQFTREEIQEELKRDRKRERDAKKDAQVKQAILHFHVLRVGGVPWHCHRCGMVLRESDLKLDENLQNVRPKWTEYGFAYCYGCDHPHEPPPGNAGPVNDNDPWRDNAVRALEGD